MRYFTALSIGLLGLAAWSVLLAQKPFKEWPAIEYENFAIPPDGATPHEWARARLRYPDIVGYPDNLSRPQLLRFAGYWTMDYPRSDRHLLEGVRRLTRIDARSVEQVVIARRHRRRLQLADALCASKWGTGVCREDQAEQLREFLIRGGFLMVDDFHGSTRITIRHQRMGDLHRQHEQSPSRTAHRRHSQRRSHLPHHLRSERPVPGPRRAVLRDRPAPTKKAPPESPALARIRDDKGRIIVAICHNMDLGDAWEYSDDPRYPEKWASLAYRIAMNYFIYDLTH